MTPPNKKDIQATQAIIALYTKIFSIIFLLTCFYEILKCVSDHMNVNFFILFLYKNIGLLKTIITYALAVVIVCTGFSNSINSSNFIGIPRTPVNADDYTDEPINQFAKTVYNSIGYTFGGLGTAATGIPFNAVSDLFAKTNELFDGVSNFIQQKGNKLEAEAKAIRTFET